MPSIRKNVISKLGGYAMWTALGAATPLAIDRLIVHPTLNAHLGPEIFGAFIWVLGVVNLFGSFTADGYSTLLMRDTAQHTKEDADRLFGAALRLTLRRSLVLVPLHSG